MTGRALLVADGASYQYAGEGRPVGPFPPFEARAGELHLVRGPSGCGKSTFARILSGLIPHLYRGRLEGKVLVDGRATRDVPLWELAAHVGLVSQNPVSQLLASTVKDEIVFGLENLGLRGAEIESRLESALDRFGLAGMTERDPGTLSGGEQQKLVLAAITARSPDALVLDEPLSMLDTTSAREVIRHLARLAEEGTAVVTMEHREAYFECLSGLKRLDLPGPAEDVDGPLPEMPQRVPAFRLVVDGLGVELGGRAVLRGIDLALSGGQVVALVGANGSGKTTLLRALSGLQPHLGRITGFVSGSSLKPKLRMVFQNPDRQIFNPTVREEILFGLPETDGGLYRAVVDLLGLGAYEETPPLLLSEGEKKRLALATVLLRPGLCGVCLDEPTLGQDQRHLRRLGRILTNLASAGCLCMVATHDLGWALEWADRLLLLREGCLVASGEPRAFLEKGLGAETGLLLPHPVVKQ